MNMAEVRHMVDQLRMGAERLRGVVSAVDGRVTHSSWHGRDADEFKHQWWPGHRQQLLNAADSLQGLAQSASNNADDQERASGGTVQVGRSPGGLTGELLAAVTMTAGIGARTFAARGLAGSDPTLVQAWQRYIKDPTIALAVSRSIERVRGVSAGGGTTLGVVPVSYGASAQVYATAHASAGVKLNSSGLAATAEAGGAIGARADAGAALGNQYLGANAHAGVKAEVGAQGSGELKIGPAGAAGNLHGDIGASVSATADGHAHISGVEAGVKAHAYAGVSAHADIGGSVTFQEVKTHVDLGASLGVGAGVGFDVDVKPSQLWADSNHLADKWRASLW
jgi:hypothetical protein